ncbi:H-NS family nucleoid-associated regulatory protein [Mesorhizobium sp.]|uniref:H-NS histone family protein n=1 Tax=Mesorhizobium sp. TaxID=1871066 RepID=UPI000FE8A137|nr:H-NS family nucleoid-associated regulatory protein [Mesorhizobium sp.]RWE79212.1 MAG: hypothetical protein EOS42_02640 [Mesorhizobium sp.]TIV32273.1 MAG: H-NS histone family protein [Mesorhizobium sp.]
MPGVRLVGQPDIRHLPDLSALSLDELTQLHHQVSQHLEERKQARIKELRAELSALTGVSPPNKGNRVGNGAPLRTRAKPEVTHEGPNGETWTGQGAVPKWGKTYGAKTRADMEKYRIN